MRIEEALERFRTQLQADGRSAHTVKQYSRHVRLFAHWARDVATCGADIEQIDHEDVARFLASDVATSRPDGERKKATAMNCLRSSMRVFLTFCHRAGYSDRDAGRLIRRAICSPPPPRGLTEVEQRELLDALRSDTSEEGKRDYALFHLLLRSGVRLGSAIALDVEDVDLAGRAVTLRATKGDRPTRAFLSDEVVEHLGVYLQDRTSGPVFLARGRRISTRHVQRRFQEWLKKAGIRRKVGVHGLRHSFAQRVYDRTHDLLVTKQALRHRSVASTLVYAHTDESRVREALA